MANFLLAGSAILELQPGCPATSALLGEYVSVYCSTAWAYPVLERHALCLLQKSPRRICQGIGIPIERMLLYSICVMDKHRKTSCLTPTNSPLSAEQRTPSMMRLRDYLRVSPPLSVTWYVQSHRICIKSNRSF